MFFSSVLNWVVLFTDSVHWLNEQDDVILVNLTVIYNPLLTFRDKDILSEGPQTINEQGYHR